MRRKRSCASPSVSAGSSARTYSEAARLVQRPAMRSSNSGHSRGRARVLFLGRKGGHGAGLSRTQRIREPTRSAPRIYPRFVGRRDCR